MFSTLLIGEGTLLILCAQILLRHGHAIEAIVSASNAIREWAREQKIRCLPRLDGLPAAMAGRPVDYLFSIANLFVVPARILALPRLGAINFHDGPLPRYAGLHATTWAILNRETSHGVTWHEMRETVDTGGILQQRLFELAPDETAFTLNRKCFTAGIESFEELVRGLGEGQVRARPQDGSERTYFGKHTRPPAQACIDWTLPAETIAAFVRALDFGSYPNPLEVPKVVVDGRALLVPRIEVLSACSDSPPGTVLDIAGDAVRVATSTTQVVIPRLLTVGGEVVTATAAGIAPGYRFEPLPADAVARLTELGPSIVRHEDFWRDRLLDLAPLELPFACRGASPPGSRPRATDTLVTPPVPAVAGDRADGLTAALILYLARIAGRSSFDVGFGHAGIEGFRSDLELFFAPQVPLHVAVDGDGSGEEALRAVLGELETARDQHTYARSLVARTPDLRGRDIRLPIGIEQRDEPEDAADDNDLTIWVSRDGRTSNWSYRLAVVDHAQIVEHQRAFTAFLQHLTANLGAPLASISLLTDAERERLLVTWNATHKAYPDEATVHALFEQQVRRTPDAVAVICDDQQRSYDELNRAANQLARHLQRLGAGPEVLVGLCLERSIDLLTGLYGILKAGAAYVPLDPAYPADRLALMVEDARCPIILTQQSLLQRLPPHRAKVVCIDTDRESIEREPDGDLDAGVTGRDLSYVIYTSGSTGRPKGVMVEHRNVVNFFAGMDERVPHGDRRTLAGGDQPLVRHLGARAVLDPGARVQGGYPSRSRPASCPRPAGSSRRRPDFSLFYFASDEGGERRRTSTACCSKGRSSPTGNGFAAVWTPERHFHAFGGLYPNPAVTSAAIAAITRSVEIRAGSCVSAAAPPDPRRRGVGGRRQHLAGPRRHLLRLRLAAERLRPRAGQLRRPQERHVRRHRDRAAPVARRDGPVSRAAMGKEVDVRTLPRPVQTELPIWVTAAGNPETFRRPAQLGASVLTHLLGQSVDDAGREDRHLPRGLAGGRASGRWPRDADAAHLRRRRRRPRCARSCAADEGLPAQLAGSDQAGRLDLPDVQAARRGDRADPPRDVRRAGALAGGHGRACSTRLRALLRDERPVRHARQPASRMVERLQGDRASTRSPA